MGAGCLWRTVTRSDYDTQFANGFIVEYGSSLCRSPIAQEENATSL